MKRDEYEGFESGTVKAAKYIAACISVSFVIFIIVGLIF